MQLAVVTVYPVANYHFGVKEGKAPKVATPSERTARLQDKFRQEGVRRTVEALLLVHLHGHPHLLLLRKAGGADFVLPGGRLRPGEGEVEGLKRKLRTKLSPKTASLQTEWRVGECAAVYWRPSIDSDLFPYLPPHATRPREVVKVFVVHLPERCYFAVPKDLQFMAVPLFDLLEQGPTRHGPVLAAVPHILSRFRLNVAGLEAPRLAAAEPTEKLRLVAA